MRNIGICDGARAFGMYANERKRSESYYKDQIGELIGHLYTTEPPNIDEETAMNIYIAFEAYKRKPNAYTANALLKLGSVINHEQKFPYDYKLGEYNNELSTIDRLLQTIDLSVHKLVREYSLNEGEGGCIIS